MKRYFLLALLATHQASAEDYAKFYIANPNAGGAAVTAQYRVAPPPSQPEVARYSDSFDAIADAHARKGYVVLGVSSFTSGRKTKDKGAIK